MRSQFQSKPAWKPPETSFETLEVKSVLFWFRPDYFYTGTSLVLALHLALFVYSLAFHLLVVFIWTLNTGIKCQPQVSSSLCAAARWELWRVCAAISSVHYITPLSYHPPNGFEFEALQLLWCHSIVLIFFLNSPCMWAKSESTRKAAQIDTNHIFHSI